MATNSLSEYQRMRDFARTVEPEGEVGESADTLSFVIQKHAARNLHYDFRLELDGTLKSWAVPKGPSLDPSIKRMAVQVEDHPVSYATFEGTIPPGQYGAGTVIVWDQGAWLPVGDARKGLRDGHLKFDLMGHKLNGRWALVRMKPRGNERQPGWLLIKDRDAEARDADDFDVLTASPNSVLKNPAAPPTTARTTSPMSPEQALPFELAPQPATLVDAIPPGDGRIRHAVFHALREDKPASQTIKERPMKAMKASSTATRADGRLHVTHAERVIDTTSGVTKGELADFYERVAPLMLPHLKPRPVALVRAPAGVDGALFFQKHADENALAGISLLDKSLDPGHEALLVVTSAEGLQSAAQMNVIELHTWNMTSRSIPKPDRMIFDLDPGEGVAWQAVREAAELMRSFLDELGLKSLLKTSGGKGLHVIVPLAPRPSWQAVRQFSQAIVTHMAQVVPQRFVAKSGPRNRVGKIFIDYLRNGWGATTASAWSARARPGLGVSVPVDWSELANIDGGAHWHLRNIDGRLAEGNEPWGAFGTSRQSLAKAMKALDFKPKETS